MIHYSRFEIKKLHDVTATKLIIVKYFCCLVERHFDYVDNGGTLLRYEI